MKLSEKIIELRKANGMTQEELAEKMSVTAQAVSKWECDTSYPDIIAIQALSKTLGVSVNELLEGFQASPEIKEAPQEIIDRRIVRIEVQLDDTNIVTRLPVPALKKAMENGTLKEIVGEDSYNQVSTILGMVDSGMTGTLVEVNTSDTQVFITVEHYED